MLMYRLRRLLVTSTDKMSAETLHVLGKPYTRPSKAIAFDRAVDGAVTPTAHCMQRLTQRPQDLKLRRLSPARTYAAYMESEDRHIATMVEPSLDYRTVWLNHERQRRTTTVRRVPAGSGGATVRKQFPTIKAPLHPDGLRRPDSLHL